MLSSSKSTLSMDECEATCCGMSPAGMSMDAVEANAEPAGSTSAEARSVRVSARQASLHGPPRARCQG